MAAGSPCRSGALSLPARPILRTPPSVSRTRPRSTGSRGGPGAAEAREALRPHDGGGPRAASIGPDSSASLLRQRLPTGAEPLKYVIVATGNIGDAIAVQAKSRRHGGGRRRGRHPGDRPVAPRLRAPRGHHRGLRRHLRHPGELQDHPPRPRRGDRGGRPLHPADELLVGAVHGGDRVDGRGRAARHAAQRRDVRHPLSRHQQVPHLRRSVRVAAVHRARWHRHQHRRGQLPDDGRRGRRGLHRDREPVHQPGVRPSRRPGPEEQMGLCHALRDRPPWLEDSFLLEIAQAQLVRQIFDRHPIKWMPPTKHKDGRHLLRPCVTTRCSIWSASRPGRASSSWGCSQRGAVHNPLLMDCYLSPSRRRATSSACKHLGDEIEFKRDGIVGRRAERGAAARRWPSSKRFKQETIWNAIARGAFADVMRTRTGGRGFRGKPWSSKRRIRRTRSSRSSSASLGTARGATGVT